MPDCIIMAMDQAHIRLNVAGAPLHLRLNVPQGAARRRELLPVFRQVSEAIVDRSVEQAEAAGERVSCRKGCGACCRQLVPVAEPEAHALRELIDGLPDERRTTVLARFAAARRRLKEAGVLDRLIAAQSGAPVDLRALGLDYFALGTACPFLDDEACSIHADRPLACREYLVTSPAERCAKPSAESVRMVRLAGSASLALRRTTPAADSAPDVTAAAGQTPQRAPWVPLVLAPEWAAQHEEEAPQPARAIVQAFFGNLSAG